MNFSSDPNLKNNYNIYKEFFKLRFIGKCWAKCTRTLSAPLREHSLTFCPTRALTSTCQSMHPSLRYRSNSCTSPNSCLCEIAISKFRSALFWPDNFASSARVIQNSLRSFWIMGPESSEETSPRTSDNTGYPVLPKFFLSAFRYRYRRPEKTSDDPSPIVRNKFFILVNILIFSVLNTTKIWFFYLFKGGNIVFHFNLK